MEGYELMTIQDMRDQVNGHWRGTLLAISGTVITALASWAWATLHFDLKDVARMQAEDRVEASAAKQMARANDERIRRIDERLTTIEKLSAERGEVIPAMRQDIRDLRELERRSR